MALIDSKSVVDWRDEMLQKWKSLEPLININPDSMVHMDALVIADVLYMLQQDAVTLTNNAFLAYATGDELSNLWSDRGIDRKIATFASGEVTFARATLANVDYLIPSGTLVSTQPSGVDGRVTAYTTTQDVTLYGILNTPWAPSATSQITGGAIGNGEYHYRITALSGDWKETDVGLFDTVTINNGLITNVINVTWTAVSGAVGYNVYLWVGPGNENNVFFLDTTTSANYIDTVGVTGSTQTPPATNETGNLSVNAPIQATLAGDSWNTAPNTVIRFINKPTGIETVTNDLEITWGANQETDAEYRERIRQTLLFNTGKVTVSWYKQTAESVAGVATASVFSFQPGQFRNEITIIITASGWNGIPNATLIQQVQDTVNADENRAVCDNITVTWPDVRTIDYTVNISQFDPGYSQTVLSQAIQDNMEAFLPTIPVWSTVYKVAMENIVHDTPGVIDFQFSVPTGNIQLLPTEMAIAWAATITFIP